MLRRTAKNVAVMSAVLFPSTLTFGLALHIQKQNEQIKALSENAERIKEIASTIDKRVVKKHVEECEECKACRERCIERLERYVQEYSP